MTLEELYKHKFDTYHMKFDNKGNFTYGDGICPYGIVKSAEQELKKHITPRRKNGIRAEVVWDKQKNELAWIRLK